MPPDPITQRNRSECQADFTYTMSVNAIKIQDTGKRREIGCRGPRSCATKDRELAPRFHSAVGSCIRTLTATGMESIGDGEYATFFAIRERDEAAPRLPKRKAE